MSPCAPAIDIALGPDIDIAFAFDPDIDIIGVEASGFEFDADIDTIGDAELIDGGIFSCGWNMGDPDAIESEELLRKPKIFIHMYMKKTRFLQHKQ